MEKNDNLKMEIMCVFFSFFNVLTLKINLDVIQKSFDVTRYANLFQIDIFIDMILFVGLYYVYKKVYYYGQDILKNKRTMVIIVSNAVMFAIFTIIGYSFYKENSWDMLFCSKVQIVKSIFFIVGCTFLFTHVLVYVYFLLDRKAKVNKVYRAKTKNFYLKYLEKYPFRTALISLIILYIPYIIASYPGIFTGDTFDLIYQGYNIPTWSSQYRPLINENVILNAHHPVAHTMLLHVCIVVGKAMTHSYNMGIFLYSMLQFTFMIIMISIFIKFLTYMEISSKITFLFIIYFAFAPRVQNYMFLLSKDVFYVAFVMLNLMMFYNLIKGKHDKKYYISFVVSSIGILLFRNDGKYMLLIMCVCVALFFKKRRRLFMVMIVGVFIFNVLYNNILLPSLQITPGSKAEMLSIPFQQTARYKRDYPNDVTKEEKEAISAILDYDNLEKIYVPSLSDKVKLTFNQKATNKELKSYFRAWFQQFCRHPGVYIEATINNLYEYISPYSNNAMVYSYKEISQQQIDIQKDKCSRYGMKFSLPSNLKKYRENFEQLREWVFSLPILVLLLKPFSYVWIVIAWSLYCIRSKNKKAILMCVPLLVQCLICVAGPANGAYFRYLYPIAMCLPIVIMSGLNETRDI